MKRNKLQKFAEILSFPNVYENYDPKEPGLMSQAGTMIEIEEGWSQTHFKNDLPLVVELACGRGEYTLELARRYPDKNFIGIDVKGARIWKGARIALQEKLENVAFLRTRIEQLHLFFQKEEIEAVWITFPDPFIKKENRRLTSPHFLRMYFNLIIPKGVVNLKTDAMSLYEYTLDILKHNQQWNIIYQSNNIYSSALWHRDLDIKTYYEKMHLNENKKITFLQFQKK